MPDGPYPTSPSAVREALETGYPSHPRRRNADSAFRLERLAPLSRALGEGEMLKSGRTVRGCLGSHETTPVS